MAKVKDTEVKAVLTPMVKATITISPDVVGTNGGLIVARKDDKGVEIPNSEFGTTMRQWDKTFSKDTTKNFFIKKK